MEETSSRINHMHHAILNPHQVLLRLDVPAATNDAVAGQVTWDEHDIDVWVVCLHLLHQDFYLVVT